MLQNYLNANLLNVTDDEDHKKLKKAADELTKRLLKSKAKVAVFALISIDPEVSAENPSIVEVKELIIKHWTTFTSNAKETPLVFIRAVILESLNNLLTKEDFSEVIWFATRNLIRYRKLTISEKDVIIDFLKKIGKSINQKAIEAWSIQEAENSAQKEIEVKNVNNYPISDVKLTKYLEDASGPATKSGEPNFESPNPVYTTTAPGWSHEFAPRASKGIKKVVDDSLHALVVNLNENYTSIQKALNDNLAVKSDESKHRILALRSELLWWKEAAYSDSTDQGYEEVDRNIVGLILAYDYSVLIPPVYPRSVDYFLKHTYKDISGARGTELSLLEFLEAIEQKSDLLNTILSSTDVVQDLPNLLNFTIRLFLKQVSISEMTAITGIDSQTKLPVEELVLWLFHDFILLKLLNQK